MIHIMNGILIYTSIFSSPPPVFFCSQDRLASVKRTTSYSDGGIGQHFPM
jgi:hypothetical protein